ncbi:MAG TPA: hypothetical protein VGL93_09435 [Streptosporangiaceae bacterium]|jgi:hypothetical protein
MSEGAYTAAVNQAFEDMRRDDPAAADRARHAYQLLTGSTRLDRISQFTLQEFLWRRMPTQWVGLAQDEWLAVTDALGRFFDLLNMSRYAEMARAPITRQVLAAYARGDDLGYEAYRRAVSASEVVPPNVPELDWGVTMDDEEYRAYCDVAAMLELAVEAGELEPGGPGWRAKQRELTSEYLTMPRPELDGDSYLDRIKAEREA